MSSALKRNEKKATLLMAMGSCHGTHDGYEESLYVFLPVWAIAFDLSLMQSGWLATIYVLALGGLQLPLGFLAERIGERILLVVGTIVTSAGFMLLGFADSFPAFVVLLLVAGAGSAVQHPLASSLVASASSPSARKPALAIYNFTGDLGKIAFPFLVSILMGVSTWQVTTSVLGAIGLVVAFGAFIVLSQIKLGARRTSNETLSASLTDWGISDQFGFTILSTIFAIDIFVRTAFVMLLPFILITKGLAVEETGFALSLLFVGGAAGKFMFGYISNWIGSLQAVILSETVTGICIFVVLILSLNQTFWLLPLLGIALNGTSSVLYGTVADFVTEKRRTRAFSLFYTIGLVTGASAPLVAGLLSDIYGTDTTLIAVATIVFITLPLAFVMRYSLRGSITPVIIAKSEEK